MAKFDSRIQKRKHATMSALELILTLTALLIAAFVAVGKYNGWM